ncbi:MAG: dihydrolipoyl dehydrogenase [Muribaculaceae bacterium]|nr:dihydrolipoyl dehydrogenase [Muribaculaceae bacterium]
MNSADILIIGAGPGGYETAARASASGKRVTLIERGFLGGTCLNRGCIPTKALCRAAEVADTLSVAPEFGFEISGLSVDYSVAAERKDTVVASLREGVTQILKGVNVVKGEAIFETANQVVVGNEIYTAPQIIIATGSTPAQPPIKGIEYALTSDDFLSLNSLPDSITVIGGGVIGLEFASIIRSFGKDVTVIEGQKEILPTFDSEIAKRLRMSLKRRGISIVTDALVTEILENGGVRYVTKGKEKATESSMTLISVGRRPVLPSGLKEAGIELTDRGFIKVDSLMRTNLPGVYAIGDVNGLSMLAHAATAQGEIAIGERESFEPVPGAVFTRPECAMVGLTEQQCIDRGIEYKVGRSTFQANGKARAMGEPDGIVKTIVSTDDGKLLGCHILGLHASDLIAEAVLCITSGLPADSIRMAVHSHPTISETLPASIPQ